MPKRTRIYTRTGDDGTTGLVGGQRVKKDALRIETYGTVDELSSVIGLARTALAEVQRTRPVQDAARANRIATRLDAWLAWTQDALFNVGSDLATLPQDRWVGMPLVVEGDALALERAIDEAEADLEPLATFIHPGGAYAGAFLHQARTVCRRAERVCWILQREEPINDRLMAYVNRLSDHLFVQSRWVAKRLDEPEYLWDRGLRIDPKMAHAAQRKAAGNGLKTGRKA